jgi:hypothetical protein
MACNVSGDMLLATSYFLILDGLAEYDAMLGSIDGVWWVLSPSNSSRPGPFFPLILLRCIFAILLLLLLDPIIPSITFDLPQDTNLGHLCELDWLLL